MAKIAPILKAQELSQDTPYVLRATLELIPSARNARTHSDKQIAKIAASIKRFKFLNPVIIDADNGIIAGHGRVLAAQKLGLETVPCILASHLTEAERRAYMLADNRIATESGWDKDLLAIELTELGDFGFDLAFTGFDDDEITHLTAPKNDGNGEDDVAPEAPATPVSKGGDVWLMGDHRVMCGDSTEDGHMAMLMGKDLADLVFTDPPYNVDYSGRGQNNLGKIENDSMTDAEFDRFLDDVFDVAKDVMKPLACIYVCHPDSQTAPKLAFERSFGERFKKSSTIIWLKQSAGMGWQDYRAQHEPILYGWKDGKGSHFYCGDRSKTTVWNIGRDAQANYVHPTQKPVALPLEAIENSSLGQQIVLDMFGGSGSTLIACEKSGRKARLMEFDPKYCDVIVRRWQDFTGLKATRESDGAEFDSLQPAV